VGGLAWGLPRPCVAIFEYGDRRPLVRKCSSIRIEPSLRRVRDQGRQLMHVLRSGKLVSRRELVQCRGVRVDITGLEPTYLSLAQTGDLPLLEPLALSEGLDRCGVVLRLPSEALLVFFEDLGGPRARGTFRGSSRCPRPAVEVDCRRWRPKNFSIWISRDPSVRGCPKGDL
jgi:hypothetical protein